MKRNFFDKLSDRYEDFHLKDSQLGKNSDVITVSPKVKLIFGWSLFVLACVLAYVFIGVPFMPEKKAISQEDKIAVLDDSVAVDEEHDTMIPYEKDANKDLNDFVSTYFRAITSCDYLRLQDMVMDESQYSDDEELKKKLEFITSYDNITVYSKDGLDEGSFVVFAVTNVSIAGVNSAPYDVVTLYIVEGERGFRINNGKLSDDVQKYIEKVKGDADIQKVFKAVEKKNEELKEKDPSLVEFFEIISRRNVQTRSGADMIEEKKALQEENESKMNTESEEQQADDSQQEDAGQTDTNSQNDAQQVEE